MKTQNIIFYGAGKTARLTKDAYHKYDPVCFVDADSSKHNTLFHGKRVLSLSQALSEYPDALFYITTSRYKCQVISQLTKHVESRRIINYESVNKRFGCALLETTAAITFGYTKGNFAFAFCCGHPSHRGGTPNIICPSSYDDYTDLAACFLQGRNNLISSLNQEEHVCKGCPHLLFDYFSDNPKLSNLGNVLPAICNVNCFYCNNPRIIRPGHSKDELDRVGNFDFVALAEAFMEQGIMAESSSFSWAAGEISISKHREKFFNLAHNHVLNISSSATIFDELLLNFMQTPSFGGELTVALDCGSRESFQRIKGLDAYQQVCDNLAKYGQNRVGSDLALKYIVCEGYNDNEVDVEGFFEIARISNASTVILERNQEEVHNPLSKQFVKIAEKFSTNAKEAGLLLRIGNFIDWQECSRKILEANGG